MPYSALFSPFRHGSLSVSNRFIMAPMTRKKSPSGVPGPDVAAYYRRRVEGGAGLIITEGTGINDPAALAEDCVPEFRGDAALTGWRDVCDNVHAAGGSIIPQLWHTGGVRRAYQLERPDIPCVSPSGLFAPGMPNGEELTIQRIEAIIEAYGNAADTARLLGFDGIELHFAHGYLVDQFFWHETNLRSDIYGEDKYLFGLRVVAECRRRVGPDFPIVMRFLQWKQQDYSVKLFNTPAGLGVFLGRMVDAEVDIFHCSTRRFWEREFEESHLSIAGWTKKLSGKPVITVGSVGLDNDVASFLAGDETGNDNSRLDLLEEIVAKGEVDLVAVGRALLADPAWVNKVRGSRESEITPFSRDALTSLR
jgi:2,4-dienoyl-CoA reductase-like NADH-dependent reductase (Old Yellow Enzyme family)